MEMFREAQISRDVEWAVSHSGVVDKNPRGCGSNTQEQRIPASDQTTQPRVPMPGRSASITSGYKIQWGLGQWKKLWDSQESPLKGPTADLGLTQTHSLWASAPEK